MRAESQSWHHAYKDKRLVARRASSHGRKLQRLGLFDLPRDARLLDLACGTGEALRILHDQGFTRLFGVDVTADEDLSREPWLELRAAPAQQIPYEDGAFDVVLCMHSLHHLGGLEGVRASVQEARRVLRPGGKLALLDHFDSPQLRAAFWALHKPWLTWPTAGLRAFRRQHEDEWPYLYDYLDAWPALRAMLDDLGFATSVDRKGLFFFYWTGTKPA
jgi:SAM-dependent methyltransferase